MNDKMKDLGLGGIIGGAAQPTPQMDHLSNNQAVTQNSSAAGGANSESQD